MAKKLYTKKIQIGNHSYEFVKKRIRSSISIYKNNGYFLRIGNNRDILKDLAFQRKLLKFGFPVANVTQTGKKDKERFFIEKSLGKKPLGALFIDNCKDKRYISDENFKLYLKLTREFCSAQLRSAFPSKRYVRKDYLEEAVSKELPNLKHDISEAFDKMRMHTSTLPFVITHGDLHPLNIMPRGVIDFEHAFYGPAGYDAIVNIYHHYSFPKKGDYEMKRAWWFSEKQIDTYMNMVGTLYLKHGLDVPSRYIDDFIFWRTAWFAVNAVKFPKLQKWEYALFKKILLDYNNDNTLWHM